MEFVLVEFVLPCVNGIETGSRVRGGVDTVLTLPSESCVTHASTFLTRLIVSAPATARTTSRPLFRRIAPGKCKNQGVFGDVSGKSIRLS